MAKYFCPKIEPKSLGNNVDSHLMRLCHAHLTSDVLLGCTDIRFKPIDVKWFFFLPTPRCANDCILTKNYFWSENYHQLNAENPVPGCALNFFTTLDKNSELPVRELFEDPRTENWLFADFLDSIITCCAKGFLTAGTEIHQFTSYSTCSSSSVFRLTKAHGALPQYIIKKI
jgi:hypothetical protein